MLHVETELKVKLPEPSNEAAVVRLYQLAVSHA